MQSLKHILLCILRLQNISWVSTSESNPQACSGVSIKQSLPFFSLKYLIIFFCVIVSGEPDLDD